MAPDEQQRVQRIKLYVLTRLREEIAHGPRGAQAQLAKRLGVSGAHLSNMLSPNPSRQPGEDFRRKVAAHWGATYAQLEALALGEDSPTSASKPVHGSPKPLPPNLAMTIASYEWMPELPEDLRLLVREQARLHYDIGHVDFQGDDWQRIVTGLEREALALVARRRTRASDRPPKKRRRA
jgi:hypothetical protein